MMLSVKLKGSNVILWRGSSNLNPLIDMQDIMGWEVMLSVTQ